MQGLGENRIDDNVLYMHGQSTTSFSLKLIVTCICALT